MGFECYLKVKVFRRLYLRCVHSIQVKVQCIHFIVLQCAMYTFYISEVRRSKVKMFSRVHFIFIEFYRVLSRLVGKYIDNLLKYLEDIRILQIRILQTSFQGKV